MIQETKGHAFHACMEKHYFGFRKTPKISRFSQKNERIWVLAAYTLADKDCLLMITIYLQTYGDCPVKQKYKTEHGIGLSLLSRGLSELYKINIPAAGIEPYLGHAEHQKPYLRDHPDIHFNISHCDGLVACGFADSPVGVDIEKIGAFRDSVIRKLLTDPEKKILESLRDDPAVYNEYFYRFWTLKESRIKQSGRGLSMPLTDFSFTFTLSKPDTEPAITCSDPDLYFHQQIIAPDYVLAVCSDRLMDDVNVKMR